MYHYMQGFSNMQGTSPYVQGMAPGFQAPATFLEGMQYFPRVDVLESLGEVIYVFDVPGVELNGVNVEIGDNTLYIEGQIDLGLKTEEINYLYRERPLQNKYARLLSIPQEIDAEHAVANVRNGLLMVRFPKKNTGRRLPVNEVQTQQQQLHQQTPQQNFNQQNYQPPTIQ